jgi:hypothetical protein|tara:strand:- start:461 stop:1042 length:582 start_codon:yes stop_codon:yes gene_type:complete
MVSQIKVNEIIKQSGSSIGIGESGDTITLTGDTINLGTTGNTINLAGSAYSSSVLCDPFFHAIRSGSHNIADQTDSVIPFNAEVADTDSAFDTSTYRFTVPSGKAGRYFFFANIGSDDGNSFNYYQTKIRKNGSSISEWMNYHAPLSSGFAQTVITLAVADYVDVVVYQNRGTTSALNPGNAATYFIGYRLTT